MKPGLLFSDNLPDIKIGVNIVEGVKVERNEANTMELLSRILTEIKGHYKLEELKDNPVVRAYRDFYWRIGIDPTKQRPSGEALLRRVLKNGTLPIINNVVDAGNIASIKNIVPIGLYDLASVEGKLGMRWAEDGEVFEPVGGKSEKLGSNQIVLSDSLGIIHVYPYRDSKRTMIKKDTEEVLVISCGVPGISDNLLKETCDDAVKYIMRLANGFNFLETEILGN